MLLSEEIKQRLQVLEPSQLEIIDDSAMHAGHKGNSGGGHFTVYMTSSHFSGKSLIMRHRLVYQQLNDLMPHKIHALSLHLKASDEV